MNQCHFGLSVCHVLRLQTRFGELLGPGKTARFISGFGGSVSLNKETDNINLQDQNAR